MEQILFQFFLLRAARRDLRTVPGRADGHPLGLDEPVDVRRDDLREKAKVGVAIALALAQRLVHQGTLLAHQIAILLDRPIDSAPHGSIAAAGARGCLGQSPQQ